MAIKILAVITSSHFYWGSIIGNLRTSSQHLAGLLHTRNTPVSVEALSPQTRCHLDTKLWKYFQPNSCPKPLGCRNRY